MHSAHARKSHGERGVALLLCMFALLLVTAVVLTMLASSDTETGINQNYRETQVAYFAAKAGVNEIVGRMKLTGGNAIAPPTIMPSTTATGGVIYVVNKKSSTEAVQPWTPGNAWQDTELCKENFFGTAVTNNGTGQPCPSDATSGATALPTGSTWYTQVASVSPFTGTSAALDYKWARITLKGNSSTYPYYTNNSSAAATAKTQVCSNGTGQVLLPTTATTCEAANMVPVYVLTALAVTPRGTRRMTQMEISKVKMPPLPSALTFDGTNSTLTPPYDAPNSNPFHVDGNDHGGCGGANHPAIGSTDDPTNLQIINGIPSNRRDHYTGGDGTVPDVRVLSNTELGAWDTPAEVEAIAAQFRAAANPVNVYPNPTNPTGAQTDINIGSQTSPQITYVDGDLTMTGTTRGGGILIVTGTLTLSGNSGFYGIILAIGKGIIQGNGGGNGQFDGAMLVAHTRDNNGNVLSTLGNPIVDWGGGGGNGIYYNTCAINSAQGSLGFKTVGVRELMY